MRPSITAYKRVTPEPWFRGHFLQAKQVYKEKLICRATTFWISMRWTELAYGCEILYIVACNVLMCVHNTIYQFWMYFYLVMVDHGLTKILVLLFVYLRNNFVNMQFYIIHFFSVSMYTFLASTSIFWARNSIAFHTEGVHNTKYKTLFIILYNVQHRKVCVNKRWHTDANVGY